jgi:hypothetical protein
MGLGMLVNALLLRDSQNYLGWAHVLEQARDTNTASTRMIERCGLKREPGTATIIVSTMGKYLTR